MFLVVDAGVKAELIDHVVALVLAACNADDAATTGFGQCAVSAANGTTGGAHGHRLTRLGGNDLDQTIPGGHAGHADCAQVVRQRHMGGVDLAQCAQDIGIDHAVLLPAAHADHLVTGFEFGVLAVHHFAHGATDHHLTQRLGHGVALALVHAAAHVGVQAHEVVLDQHLAVLQGWNGGFNQLEVGHSGFALGAVVEHDLVVDGHGSVSVWVIKKNRKNQSVDGLGVSRLATYLKVPVAMAHS